MNLPARNSLMDSQNRNSEKMKQQDSESHISKLANDLSLSDDQITELTKIINEHSEKMEKMHQSGSTDRTEMRTKREKMQKELDTRIMKILNEDQQEKFLELQKNRPDGPRERK